MNGLDLGSGGETRGGSSPPFRTISTRTEQLSKRAILSLCRAATIQRVREVGLACAPTADTCGRSSQRVGPLSIFARGRPLIQTFRNITPASYPVLRSRAAV